MDTSSSHGDKYRSFMYGEGEKNTVWRNGAPPNYDLVNKLFEEGRTQEWPIGSVEEKVQRLVKSWEMEMVNKVRVEDYKTLNPQKFTFSVNGRPSITIAEIRQMGGSYNAFLQTALPKELRYYDPAEETTKSSNDAFTTTFPAGLPSRSCTCMLVHRRSYTSSGTGVTWRVPSRGAHRVETSLRISVSPFSRWMRR
ncbi:hypothetical protein QJS04_geneDACA010033 [Acorus gramineus]|uniref:Uncharacterized protein n=1 Tax=Acorus gramineus TaxID=55184 RepID=A0AAV9BHF7_ACOGR|nr:hypothetical protein QJS04_geneDACA010033 [Acorus gramineus]